MKIKMLVSGILLLFVGISFAYLVINESRPHQAVSEIPSEPIKRLAEDEIANVDTVKKLGDNEPGEKPVEPTQDVPMDDRVPQRTEEPNHCVIAYYFHGTKRCMTCRTIEAFAEESLRTKFPDELEAGKLEWRVVNIDTPENEHFVQDYKLATRSLVLVEMRDGEQKQWKNLTKIWELVRDKPSFVSYVQEETKEFLGE